MQVVNASENKLRQEKWFMKFYEEEKEEDMHVRQNGTSVKNEAKQ